MCPLTYEPLNNYLEGASYELYELYELVHHGVVHVDRSLERTALKGVVNEHLLKVISDTFLSN